MLSSLVVSKQIDARSHNNKRTRFRLDTRVYLANPRLIEVGATVVGPEDAHYPTHTGVDALVDNVLVYSGTTLIGDCREWFRYAGYKNGQKSNENQYSVMSLLKRTRQGTLNKFVSDTNESEVGYGFVLQKFRDNATPRNLVTAANLGYIRLSDFVEFFNATPYLSYIPNLEIVIEWGNLATAGRLDVPSGAAITSYTILEPRLVIDELVDEAALQAFKPEMAVNYLNVEYAKQDIAKPADTVNEQRTPLRPKTFDGKYLKDLVMAVTPSVDSHRQTSGLGTNAAFALYNEKITLYLNGSNMLQQDGIDSPARKMLFNKISRGALSRNLTHYLPIRDQDANLLDDDRLKFQQGRQAYTAIGVEDLVNHFDIDFRRVGFEAENQDYYDAANVHLFGRVAKSFVLKGGRVAVAY